MLLSIIIVSYNTKSLTLQAVESAQKDIDQSKLLANQTEIIVVDNNSGDDSVEALKKNPSLKIITNQKNLGFAAANNQGIKIAQGQYLLLLNSDTIVQTGALEALVKTLQSHPLDDTSSALRYNEQAIDRLGIISAQLQNPDHSIQPEGGSLPSLITLFNQMLFLDDLPIIGKKLPSSQETGRRYQSASTQLINKGWVAGTAMMIRREVINEIGDLDENIFMYGEDVEFCLRASSHHWDIAEMATAKIIHLGSASSSSAQAIKGELKAYLYIWSKHFPVWQMPFLKLIIKLGCGLRLIVFGTMRVDLKRRQVYKELLSGNFN